MHWREQVAIYRQMVRRQLLTTARYPLNLAAEMVVPVVMALAFTLTTLLFAPDGPAQAAGPLAGVPVYGFVIYLTFSNALWRMARSVREEQWQGTLAALHLTPAPPYLDLLARVSLTTLWTLASALLAVAAAHAIVGRLPMHLSWRAAYVLALTLSGSAGLGFAMAAYTLIVREGAEIVANLLEFALLVVCAGFYPFSALPPAMRAVSRWVPFSYSVDAFRALLLGAPAGWPELAPLPVELWIITLFGVASPLVGYQLYRVAERGLRRAGQLGDY